VLAPPGNYPRRNDTWDSRLLAPRRIVFGRRNRRKGTRLIRAASCRVHRELLCFARPSDLVSQKKREPRLKPGLCFQDPSGRLRRTPNVKRQALHTFSNFVQTAPFFALLTAVAMNAMPVTPSSTFGKSTSLGIGLPATSASIARAASR